MKYRVSICIITYNRGLRALLNVKNILENINFNQSVLVLNNASTVGEEYYEEIEKLAIDNEQLTYIRHKSNLEFHGNFRASFDYAKSKYIMIISDEDFVNFDCFESIISDLDRVKNIGACRPAVLPHKDLEIPLNSFTRQDKYFKAGQEALHNFSFSNNYLSGIIYNLDLINSKNILETFDKNILRHVSYPHLYLDMLVAATCDVSTTSKASALENKPEATLIGSGNNFSHVGLYGFGERVNQFLEFRDAIVNSVDLMNFNSDSKKIELFVNLFLKLAQRYFFLIFKAGINNYLTNKMEISCLKESFFMVVCSSCVNHPYIGSYKSQLLDKLTEIYTQNK